MSIHQNAERASISRTSRKKKVINSDKVEFRRNPNTKYTDEQVEELREELKPVYGTPFETSRRKEQKGRFTDRTKFHLEFFLQVVKVVTITFQCIIFSGERRALEDFGGDNLVAFQNIFLKNWPRNLETPAYPPARGPNAVFTTNDFYNHLDHFLSRYFQLDDLTLSSVTYYEQRQPVTLDLCRQVFQRLDINVQEEFYNYDPELKDLCCSISKNLSKPNCSYPEEDCFDIREFFKQQTALGNANCSLIDFKKLLKFKARFKLSSINIRRFGVDKLQQPIADADCITFKVTVVYDNQPRTGVVRTDLMLLTDHRRCSHKNKSSTIDQQNWDTEVGITVYDVIVILACITSVSFEVSGIFRAIKLRIKTKHLLKDVYYRDLELSDEVLLISPWHLIVIVSDGLTIIASCIKIFNRWDSNRETFHRNYVWASFTLGLAIIFEWFSVIRYLVSFDRYYVLIHAITHATPAILKYLVCVTIIWFGFMMSGWIILGPYSIKFSTLWVTIDCLFSLIHGDEVYPTLATITMDQNLAVWIFSKIYIYGFIVLYTVIVINLMIAIITASYDTVKIWHQHGPPTSFLDNFARGNVLIIKCDNAGKRTQEEGEMQGPQRNEGEHQGGHQIDMDEVGLEIELGRGQGHRESQRQGHCEGQAQDEVAERGQEQAEEEMEADESV